MKIFPHQFRTGEQDELEGMGVSTRRCFSEALSFAAWAGRGWAEGLSSASIGQPSPPHLNLAVG